MKYNSLGKLILKTSFNAQGTEIPTNFNSSKIDVSQWATGIYYLYIRTAEGNNYTKKLIKE